MVKNGKPLDRDLRINLTTIAVQYRLARLSWDGELIILTKPPLQQLGNIKIIPPEELAAKFFLYIVEKAATSPKDPTGLPCIFAPAA